MTLKRSRIALVFYVIGLAALALAAIFYLYLRAFELPVQLSLALGVLMLGAAVIADPERVRRALSGRQAKFGTNALVLGGAFVGLLVVVNLVAINYPQRLDLTEDKEFSLRDETALLLSELAAPVSLIGFYSPDRATARDQIRPTLDEYVRVSEGLVSYEFVDPRANPLAADRYGITRDGSLAVSIGDQTHVIEFPTEVEITSAIVRLTNPENRTVYFLTGHGENSLDGLGEASLRQFKQALESKSYVVLPLNLAVEGGIPDDAAAIVAAAPRSPLSEDELDLIDTYLSAGGGLVALLEPSPVTELPDAEDTFNAYLKDRWGVHGRDDFVVDLESMHPLVGLSFVYGSHAITDRVQNFLTQFPSARSIAVRDRSGATIDLISTSTRSWGETDFAAVAEGGSLEVDPDSEVEGPLALAVALDDLPTEARLVVVGDVDFATDDGFFAGGNADLIVNSVDWAAKLDNLIDITPRQPTRRQVVPATMTAVLSLSLFVMVLIPGLILLAGVGVWWSRRSKV